MSLILIDLLDVESFKYNLRNIALFKVTAYSL